MEYDLIIFDLDGTLIDTSLGIFNSVRYVEYMLTLPKISEHELKEFVGPPPYEMYVKKYDLTDEVAKQAVFYHRKYGVEKGIYETVVYPQIPELLSIIDSRKCRIAVATLKNEKTAVKLLKYHKLDEKMWIIAGMDEQETRSKKDIISMVIRGSDARFPLMVGDSIYDYKGAQECGIDFVGVSYGFGLDQNNTQIKMINYPMELIGILNKGVVR